jgi:Lon protease-like protein
MDGFKMSEIEVALFPIPGSVSFPGDTVTLHVFEPRYRKMITDCVAEGRRVGVAHTLGVLTPSKTQPGAPLKEQLNQNQSTYLAHPVFSAGFVEVKQTLADGRLLIQIPMDGRYQMKTEIQQVPYKIFTCQSYEDQPEPSLKDMRDFLDQEIIRLFPDESGQLEKYILSDEWQNQSDSAYSFKVYSIFKMEPDFLQQILVTQSAKKRLEELIQYLGLQ